VKSSLTVIDSRYLRPSFDAVFLREESDEVALIEASTRQAGSLVLAALEARGIRPEAVRYLIVTHAHLDHAGGAGALMKALPRAILVAHPRAARHLIDPAKLEKSARLVYGDEAFDRLYGALDPVPADRVQSPEDGASLPFGAGVLTFLHTRGHAKHHFCILDEGADAIFTGDSFGLAYPELQGRGLFVFPSTSPTDFEGEEALASVERIASSGAGRALLTHFGELRNLGEARRQLRDHLDFCLDLLAGAGNLAAETRRDFILAGLFEHYAEARALAPDPAFLDLDLGLNADGLALSLTK